MPALADPISTSPSKSVETKLQELIEQRETTDLRGNRLHPTGTITLTEARFIQSLIREHELRRCVETGVAFGGSTVAICGALAELEKQGRDCLHVGVDPCQMSDYGGAAIAAVRECGLGHLFELLEGPSHTMLPKLLERGEQIDLGLVDGWHTFDYTLVDVFLIDKLLRPGGLILMHDMNLPSKQKVRRFLKTHRRYRVLSAPRRPMSRRVLSAGKKLTQFKPLSAIHTFRMAHPLLVLQKVESFEPGHDFFRGF